MVRRSTLSAIHVAKKQLDLDDDDYRAMLRSEAGVASARDLDEAGARRVMTWFDNHGFKRTGTAKGTAADRRPIVQKARAIWISLYQLDEVSNRSDNALDAFAKNITGKETLHFATNGEAGKVVEALKAWAERVGWTAGTRPPLSLVQLQYERLAAHQVAVGNWVRNYEALPANSDGWLMSCAAAMGAAIRRLKLGTRHNSPSQTEGNDRG